MDSKTLMSQGPRVSLSVFQEVFFLCILFQIEKKHRLVGQKKW